MKNRNCENCRYFVHKLKMKDFKDGGLCFRYPQRENVLIDEFCGEFELKNELVEPIKPVEPSKICGNRI